MNTFTSSEPELRAAAFFGLDNTLIPGSSLYLLAQGLHQRDFYDKLEILRFAWQQWLVRRGSEPCPRLASSTEAALEFVSGRDGPAVRALAAEITAERIVPQVYGDMAAVIEGHRAQGVLTFVTTAAPTEVAEVVAQGLGMTGALGTRAEIDDANRYSGRLSGAVLHGSAKADAVEAHAREAGIDLGASVAYSDSIHDLPLLELVGRAEVVNPDRRLRRVAAERGWEVRRVRPSSAGTPFPSATPHVARRLADLGLEAALRPHTEKRPATRTHQFVVEDPDALVAELEASGRFRRDTRLGSLFHPGQVSLREVSPTHSLHITVSEGNRVSAHLDRYSPLAPTQPEHRARYSLPRVAAHNLAGMVGDIGRLVPRRRRKKACACPPETRPAGGQDSEQD
ncbi:MAG: HAD-IB family hydrolase [Actinobacteria bacterium]|nr:HAD-IB family hydrolase [Actinomycetota bacterium]